MSGLCCSTSSAQPGNTRLGIPFQWRARLSGPGTFRLPQTPSPSHRCLHGQTQWRLCWRSDFMTCFCVIYNHSPVSLLAVLIWKCSFEVLHQIADFYASFLVNIWVSSIKIWNLCEHFHPFAPLLFHSLGLCLFLVINQCLCHALSVSVCFYVKDVTLNPTRGAGIVQWQEMAQHHESKHKTGLDLNPDDSTDLSQLVLQYLNIWQHSCKLQFCIYLYYYSVMILLITANGLKLKWSIQKVLMALERIPPTQIPQILIFCCFLSIGIGVFFTFKLGVHSVFFSIWP